jgi:hypothetical protein
MPASKYPTSAGRRSRTAMSPNRNARPRPAAMVAMSAVSCGIGQVVVKVIARVEPAEETTRRALVPLCPGSRPRLRSE